MISVTHLCILGRCQTAVEPWITINHYYFINKLSSECWKYLYDCSNENYFKKTKKKHTPQHAIYMTEITSSLIKPDLPGKILAVG